MTQGRLKHFGWGREGEGLTAEEEAAALARYRRLFDVEHFDEVIPPSLSEIELRPPRLAPPAALAPCCSSDPYDRIAHTYGKSFSDYARGLLGRYDNAPDVVAYPRNETEVAAILDWAGGAQAAVTPFGGGSSVVGGVEPRLDGTAYKAAITLDLRHMNRVLEIDRTSRAARIEAGVFGPALEAQLKPHALTLRHFPQSFEYSTLGGWIATRSGGHFATLYTHIDDLVESLRVVTPRGLLETRRLPGSGAGPSPDRLFIGSEGILGVITAGVDATAGPAALSRGRCDPLCRFLYGGPRCQGHRPGRTLPGQLPDSRPARSVQHRGGGRYRGDPGVGVRIGRPSARRLDEPGARMLRRPSRHTRSSRRAADGHREGAAGVWRNAFIRMPYAREHLVRRAIIADTFETAITWERFEAFHDTVKAATETGDSRGHGAPGAGHLPLHPRLPRWAGALLHIPRARTARRSAGAMAGDQKRRERRADRRRGYHHPPPRGRPRSPAMVR